MQEYLEYKKKHNKSLLQITYFNFNNKLNGDSSNSNNINNSNISINNQVLIKTKSTSPIFNYKQIFSSNYFPNFKR